MKGYIITYKVDNSRDIVKLNHYLFGKITSVKDKKYYYQGVLDNIMYHKFNDGCYFITNPHFDRDNFNVYEVEIDLTEDELITSRKKWKLFAEKNKISVKNL